MKHNDRSSNLRIEPELKPPRPWAEMLDTWDGLADGLFVIGVHPPPVGNRWLGAWRWMWAFPPCSEARKAAFTLGHAALLIERWRLASVRGVCPRCSNALPRSWECDGCALRFEAGEIDDGETIGQRAEALLRIARWHIDDARGEAHGRTLGVEPTIPPHERVYEGHRVHGQIEIRYGGMLAMAGDRINAASSILADHFAIRSNVGRQLAGEAADRAFAETAIASLPDGPWTMTSQDVSRFLDMILEAVPALRRFRDRDGAVFEETLAPVGGDVYLRRAGVVATNGVPWSADEMRAAGMVEAAPAGAPRG